MTQEFKDFVNRGNVMDLAVAVVLGTAFGLVVTSFVDNVLMQIVAAIVGEPNFDSVTFGLGDSTIFIGTWITAVINFVLIAFAVFLVVKTYTATRKPAAAPGEEGSGPSEVDLLTEIRDALTDR